ncbi:MAG TPA: hypothetical protein PLR99_01250 [Polyangiaceae bacterium]|nr:hypothetical protein [Polyangiaceae bacterium]
MMPLSSNTRRVLAWLAAALGLLAAAWFAVFTHTRLDRELSKLPEQERRALYERTRETLRTSCAHPRGPEVADYCRQQANFIKHFPECDGECQDVASQLTPPRSP